MLFNSMFAFVGLGYPGEWCLSAFLVGLGATGVRVRHGFASAVLRVAATMQDVPLLMFNKITYHDGKC